MAGNNPDFEGGIAPVQNTSGGDSTTLKLTFNRGSIKYDNPFLDITSMYMPVSIKGILRFVSVFAMGDSLVAQCISKLSEYPITKLIYNENEKTKIKDDKTVDFWKNLLEKKIDIVRVDKEAGMDYHAYGNSIVSISLPFKRMLKCSRCREEFAIESVTKVVFQNYKYRGKCPKCGAEQEMEARDMPTKEVDRVRVIRWDLQLIDIKYNNISGDHFYYYTVPPNIRDAIRRGDLDIVNTTRLEIIKAIKKNKQIKLMADNLYHMKRPGPQYMMPSERGWGISSVLAVMKDIFHTKILKKGNEMISFDHIVPFRTIFPAGTGDVSPHAQTNLGAWRSRLEEEIVKWRQDPNYISIMPFPMGVGTFGGDAKLLMVGPEIRQAEDDIVIGMGVIPEIIRGGASWSGSNVSLRVVENTFLNHRQQIDGLHEFIIKRLAAYFEKPEIDLRMADFKMADDLEKKKILVNGASGPASGRLFSKTTALKEMDFDPEKEMENIENELKDTLEIQIREAEGNAEAQGAGQIVAALFNVDANYEAQKRDQSKQGEARKEQDKATEVQRNQTVPGMQQEVAQLNPQISLPEFIYGLTRNLARLAQIDPNEFKIRMVGLKQSMPNLFTELYRNLQEMKVIEADLLAEIPTPSDRAVQPGLIPTYTQNDVTAQEQPGPAERGMDPKQLEVGRAGPLPEQKPPRGDNRIV